MRVNPKPRTALPPMHIEEREAENNQDVLLIETAAMFDMKPDDFKNQFFAATVCMLTMSRYSLTLDTPKNPTVYALLLFLERDEKLFNFFKFVTQYLFNHGILDVKNDTRFFEKINNPQVTPSGKSLLKAIEDFNTSEGGIDSHHFIKIFVDECQSVPSLFLTAK